MNLPTKLTVLRIIMIPVFVATFFIQFTMHYAVSAAIFALAAITDFLDGYIARKYDMVTDLGKFLDPIADKVLVASAFIIMLTPVGAGILPWYCSIGVSVILARELIISGFRMVAAAKGAVISADKSGKVKTFLQDMTILVLLIAAEINPALYSAANIIGLAFFGLSVVLTVVSGAECIIKNRAVLKTEKPEDGQHKKTENNG